MSTDFVLGFGTAVLLGVAAFITIAALHFTPPSEEDK